MARIEASTMSPQSPSSRDSTERVETDRPKRGRRHDDTDPPPKRRKVACQSCRLKKIKCDARKPICSICNLSGTECEYPDEAEKVTLESATERILERLSRIEEIINSNTCRSGLAEPSADPSRCDAEVLRVPICNKEHGTADVNVLTKQKSGIEPSRDFQHIPAHRTTADAVLEWEVFEGLRPPMVLAATLFVPPSCDHYEEAFTVEGGIVPVDEERVPSMVDNFLENVHTKNPILDVEQLVKRARLVPTTGLGWDSSSCLVLIACALGFIAKPFNQATPSSPPLEGLSRGCAAGQTGEEMRYAESYFILACRRIGTLKHSLIAAQCYFFAGVYLMYTLRPILSWQYFTQASTIYQLHIRTAYALTDISQLTSIPTQSKSALSKQQRLEQCMYWSCFKTECEFRVELPLPVSDIASHPHPQMFPSPPTPAGSHSPGHFPTPTSLDSPGDIELKQHSKRLCNEEESWYYYLTEIALRRIGNRIINTFFSLEPKSWMDIEPLLDIAAEFDTQVSAWSANLPPPMREWETSYTIRLPNSVRQEEGKRGGYVSRELSWATENRLLEIRSWLYQPFLYYFIHHKDPRLNHPAGPHAQDLLAHLIRSGIECNIKILDVRSLRHRHHGLWYDLRSITCAALVLLAIVKSGQESCLEGGVEELWGINTPTTGTSSCLGGRIGNVLGQLDHWSSECPSLAKHKDVLDQVTREVQRQRKSRLHISEQTI